MRDNTKDMDVEKPDVVERIENGTKVLKEAGTMKWVKGTPSPNPGGRPKREKFEKLLHTVFDDETMAFMMFAKLNGLKTNVCDVKDIVKLIDDTEMRNKFRAYLKKIRCKAGGDARKGWSFLSEREQVELIKWIFECKYGKAIQFSEISTPPDRKLEIEFVNSEDVITDNDES